MNALHDLDIETLEYYIEGGYDYFLSIGVPKLMMNNGIKNINILVNRNKESPSLPEQVEQIQQAEHWQEAIRQEAIRQEAIRQEAIRQETIQRLLKTLKDVSRKMVVLNNKMMQTRNQELFDNLIYQRNVLNEDMDRVLEALDEAEYVHPPPSLFKH